MRIDLASSTRGEEVVRWIVLTEESSLAGEEGQREDLCNTPNFKIKRK
jgi:hypothetical protein